ncbi:hypothetical protein BCR32DRAFT_290197 [Anaeromyces robustus]|uniref:Myb-like domain-containing protein n=1 Tax=Anaeromyces robustus TaxID=1754192 RepID=A0A1Y1XKD1_9FUNG|nr:hypothetical protein BCR32DRAFT_290197 [Anaeromyces robustus]|eukprot:ORX86219.1 hypothetical protein BCR32DRAFT_290197 [Anaeromyces robustus]
MDKLIVTSLRVNKNQKKFTPSLKKAKKNKNKKLEKSIKNSPSVQTSLTTPPPSTSILLSNENIKKSDASSNLQQSIVKEINKSEIINTTQEIDTSVSVRKLDTLKESRFCGLTNSKITPKKITNTGTRLKLLTETLSDGNVKPQILISSNSATLTPQTLSQPQLQSQSQSQSHSHSQSHSQSQLELESQILTPSSSIPSSPLSISKSSTTPDNLNNSKENVIPLSNNIFTSIEKNKHIILPIKSNKTSNLNIVTPLIIEKQAQDSLSKNVDSIKSSELLISSQKLKENDILVPIKTSNSSSNNQKEGDNKKHLQILSESNINTKSSSRKRKCNFSNYNDNDDEETSPVLKRLSIINNINEDNDFEDGAYTLINSKLDTLITKSNALEKVVSKYIDYVKESDNIQEKILIKKKDKVIETNINKIDNDNNDSLDKNISQTEIELENSNTSISSPCISETEDTTLINIDNTNSINKKNEIDIKDNDKYQILLNENKNSNYNSVEKAHSALEELENEHAKIVHNESIVFNKRTLADIIDNYHGKELSNIQKEKYKLAARKRKATLRRKRLIKLGLNDDNNVSLDSVDSMEPDIEVKTESSIPMKKSPNKNVAAVQMRVVNGQVVIDQNSLFINHIDTSNELPITLKENKDTQVTSLSFKRNSNRSKKWKKEETDLFYQCISICGTDFGMMSIIMPHRNRKQLINKYHRETRLNPERVRKAFEKRKILDNNNFNAILEKINQNKDILNISKSSEQ